MYLIHKLKAQFINYIYEHIVNINKYNTDGITNSLRSEQLSPEKPEAHVQPST